MKISNLIFIMLILLLISPFFITIMTTPLLLSNTEAFRASPNKVPAGALQYALNSSNPSKTFSTADFVPENPHIGYYSIRVGVRVWISSGGSNSDIRIFNLWNACAPVFIMSHEEHFDIKYEYIYHRPSVNDPDFAVALRLHYSSGMATGWILIYFEDDGKINPPSNFIMPSDQSCYSITFTSYLISNESSSTSSNDVSIPIYAFFVSLLILSTLSRSFRLKKRE